MQSNLCLFLAKSVTRMVYFKVIHMNVLKILMLEDEVDDAGLIERMLQRSGIEFISKLVDSREEFIEALESFNPQIILSDHSLPQFNSIEGLKIIQEKKLNIPFILVTGAVSEEFAVNCLRDGADDYILKGNLARLPSAILNALKRRNTENDRHKAEESLFNQNQELIKINKELDKFVYSASHDLRAPLKSVLGLVMLAQYDVKINKYESLGDYFNMMEESIYKLDNTIKDIINYSRNNRTEVSSEKVILKHIINESIDNFRYLEDSASIEKSITVHETKPLFSDSTRLKILFNNIISNAIKYRKTGAREQSYIAITAEVLDEKAIIHIEDNGIGINEKVIQKIFDMFYRGTEMSQGSGLGLYIVKETLEKLKGTIEVSSELNKKTIFKIEIPNNKESNIEVK
jgi:signal transduction histidine kinase